MPRIREDAGRRIDEYIARAAEFARPICHRLRELVREAHPDLVEDWKWGPNFNRDGMVCGLGAFKRHVTLHFFKGALMEDPDQLFVDSGEDKGSRSMKFEALDQIDAEAVVRYVRHAVELNERGARAAVRKPPVRAPGDLREALSRDRAARTFFEGLPPGYRREYVEWIEGAKRAPTRERRIAETVARCGRSERLNDRYRKGC